MAHSIKHLFRSPLLRNASQLLTANVVAQAVALAVYPLLSRLYTADDFGVFNIFLTISGILVLLATMQYEYAVVLPHSHRQGAWVAQAVLVATAAVVAATAASIPFASGIEHLLDADGLARLWWLMPLYVAVMASWALCNFWLLRHDRFDRAASYQVDQSLLNATTKAVAGKMSIGGGLIYGSVLAPALALSITLLRTPRALWRKLCHIEWRGMRAAAHRYRNFPRFTLPKALTDSLASNLPLLILAPAFDLATVGFVGMAFTLAHRPINIICSSVNKALYQQAAQHVQCRKPIRHSIARYAVGGLLIAMPLFVLLYFALPWLCSWMLGAPWAATADYIRLMLPWLLMVLVSNGINFIPDLFDRQRGLFLFSLARLVLQAAALAIGISLHSPLLAMGLFFAVAAMLLVAQTVWFFALIKNYEQRL